MYFWAELNEDHKWQVNKIELELNKHPGKRLNVETNRTEPVPDVSTDSK